MLSAKLNLLSTFVTVTSRPAMSDLGKEYEISDIMDKHYGSRFTKTKYPLLPSKASVWHTIPFSAVVVEIIPQQQRADPLIAGFCKKIQEVQQVVLDFYCNNAIEIYLEKSLSTENYGQDFQKEYEKMGVSACVEDERVLIGYFGETEGSVYANIKSVFLIPKGTMFTKGRSRKDDESTLISLDGHASVALNIGKKEVAEKREKSKQATMDWILNANDIEKEQILSYIAGQIEEDIADKSPQEIAELHVKKNFQHVKDWNVLKEEPDYTHFRKALGVKEFIAKQKCQPEFELWSDEELKDMFVQMEKLYFESEQ